MRYAKLSLLVCWGLLACSGRYVVGRNEGGGAGTGAGADAGNGVGVDMGVGVAGTVASGGTTAVAPPPSAAGAPQKAPEMCGLPLVAPAVIEAPITNTMMWSFRLSNLIWGDAPHTTGAVPTSLSYELAGELADLEIDRAIAETKGIPGAAAFVRDWLQIDFQASLLADWPASLSQGPALQALLGLRFDTTRVGAFTEPAFLLAQQSISARGVVMVNALFNLQVPPEPPGLSPTTPPPGLTRRETLAQAVANPACASCHHLFDPLGWSLENYDVAGKFVTTDAGKPVDASGSYQLPVMGSPIDFKSVADLNRQLSNTCDINLGFPSRFLDFALRRSLVSSGIDTANETDITRLQQAFMYEGQTYRSLLKAFALSYAIR